MSASRLRFGAGRVLLMSLALAAGCDGCRELPVCDPGASVADVDGIWKIEGEGERVACADPRYNGEFKLGPSSSLLVEVVRIALEDGGPGDAGLAVDTGPSEAGSPEAGPAEAGVVDLRPEAGAREAGPSDGAALDGGLPDRPGQAPIGDGALDGIADLRLDRRSSRPRPYRYLLRLRNPLPGFAFNGEVQGSCVSFETEEQDLLGSLTYQFKGEASRGKIEGRFSSAGPEGCLASGTFEVEVR